MARSTMGPLENAAEEMFCQLRVDRATLGDCYNTAFKKTLKAESATRSGHRIAQKDHIKDRIAAIVTDRREALHKLCLEWDASRANVIAQAVMGWRMAYQKGDIAGMSRHNNDIANFARDSSWGNRVEVAHEGSIDQLLREVEEQGPFRPGEH